MGVSNKFINFETDTNHINSAKVDIINAEVFISENEMILPIH